MSRSPLRHRLAPFAAATVATLALIAAGSTACTTDEPVVGPGCDGPCVDAGTDSDAGEVSQGETTPVAPEVQFFIKSNQPNLLDGNTISAPIDGTYDTNPALKGLQVKVVVQTNAPKGAEVVLRVNGLPVGVPLSWGATDTFDDVTIPCTTAPVPIAVEVKAAGLPQGDKAKSLGYACQGCTAELVAVPACITEDSSSSAPGFQHNFQVKGSCDFAEITGTDVEGVPIQSAKVPLQGGLKVATVQVTLSSKDKVPSGSTATVAAVVTDQTGDREAGTSKAQVVAVGNVEPKILLDAPQPGPLTKADDLDAAAAGIQVAFKGAVSGVTPAQTDGISITVDGSPPVTTTAKDAKGSFEVVITFPKTGIYAVVIKAKTDCGVPSSASFLYSVSASIPKPVLEIPKGGPKLLAKDDADPSTTLAYETTLTVSLDLAADVSEVEVWCNKAGASVLPDQLVGVASVTSETVLVPVSINVAATGPQVTCWAVALSPNKGVSPKVDLTVALPPPCLVLTAPAEGAALKGFSLPIAATAANLDGKVVTAVLQAGLVSSTPAPVGPVVLNGLAGSVALWPDGQKAQDGLYTVTIDATDAFGNQAADSACSSVKRSFWLDNTAPSIEIALPTKPTLTTVDDPDADPVKPGFQAQVSIKVSGAASLCAKSDSGEEACVAGLANDPTTVAVALTLQPGYNEITVTAKDALGNSDSKKWIGELKSDKPVVKFSTPGSNAVVTALDAYTFVAKVTAVGGAPLAGAITVVIVDGKEQVTAVSEGPAGTYTFTVAGLAGKASAVTKVAFGAAASGSPDKMGYTVEVAVTHKVAKPAITITSPIGGEALNLQSPLCLAGAKDCQLTVKAAVTDGEDGSTATLTGTCTPEAAGGAPIAVDPTPVLVSAGVASFAGVDLKHGHACTLTAKVVDLAGNATTSAAVTVVVDRVAPAFTELEAPPAKKGTQLVFVATDEVVGDPNDKFVTVNITLSVSGVAAGATVTLTVTDDKKAVASFTAKVPATVGDSGLVKVPFDSVKLPDGEAIQLEFTVIDKAGNKGSKVFFAQVAAKQASVKVADPSNLKEGVACSADDQCKPGLCVAGSCGIGWSATSARKVTVEVGGIKAGGTLVICSDLPGLVGAPCQSAGYTQVATQQTSGGSLESVLLPASLPDGVHHFIAEASKLPDIGWTTSLASQNAANTKRRTILIDTIAPVVKSLTAPASPGAAAPCLSDKAQSKPDGGLMGGTFTFTVTTAGDATVNVAGGGAFGTGLAVGGSAAIAVSLAGEGTATFTATAYDRVGNASAPLSIPPVLVDTQAPTGAFLSPVGAKVLMGASLDVVVSSPAVDALGQDVTLTDGAAVKGATPLVAGQALFAHSTYGVLSDGDHLLGAQLRDVCGNINATVATSPLKVTVDTTPPTVAITAPASGASFGDTQDADTSAGGYQVKVTFSAGDAVATLVELAEGCDAGFANCSGGYKAQGSGTATTPGLTDYAVNVTIPFGAGTNYSLRVTVTDANGNKASAVRGFKVALTGCLVSLKGLASGGVYNTASCAVANQSCASITTQLTVDFVGPCGTVANVQLKKGGAEVAKKAPTGASAVFSVVVNDNDNTTVEAVVQDGAGAAKASSGPLPVKADLKLPTIAFVAGTVGNVATLAGPGPVLVGKAADLHVDANHQAHLQLLASDSGLAGGKLTKLDRTVGATSGPLSAKQPLLPVSLTGTSATIDIQFAVLQADATNTVTATVTDASGNAATAQIAVVVDWISPSAPALAAFKPDDLDARRPMARLNFKAPGDNGDTGTAKKYLVRYSAKPIANQGDFNAACDAEKLPAATVATPAVAGTSQVISIEGPDPRPTTTASPDPCKFVPFAPDIDANPAWYFAVQAQDAAGNLSPLSNVLNTTQLRLRYAFITLGGALATADMRTRIYPVGDLNGDGLGDFTLGGGTATPLCVVYGRNQATLANIDLSAQSAYPSHVCLANPGGLGAPVASGGDVNGDGVGDLVVGRGTGTGAPRFVDVYLGKKGAAVAATPAFTVTGPVNTNTADGVWKVAIVGNWNGDSTAGGKPIDDIAITTRHSGKPGETYERVILLPGNPAWSEATPKKMSVDNAAERILNKVATIRLKDQAAGSLGTMLLRTGNLIADGSGPQYDDLLISQYSLLGSIYVVKGRPITTDMEIQLSAMTTTTTGDAGTVAVRGNSAVSPNGFALTAAVVNIDGDAIPDIVAHHGVSAVGGGGLYWFRGSFLANNLGNVLLTSNETAVIGDTKLFTVPGGYRLNDYHWIVFGAGNFANRSGAGGPFIDLVHGRSNSAADGGSNRVVVRYGVVRPKSLIPNEASFLVADLDIYDPAAKPKKAGFGIVTTGTLGPVSFAPLGDFNADGLPDLVIGSTDGSLVIVY